MEAGTARDDLHVLLRAAVLERELVLRKGPHDVEEEPAGKDDGAVLGLCGRHADPDPHLHVGRLELQLASLDSKEDAGEGLDGAAGGRSPYGDPKSGQERFTGNGQLHRTAT